LSGARHIGDAAGITTENGRATSKAFKNSIREVVGTARAKKKVDGGVVPRECVGTTNVAGVMDGKVGGKKVGGLLSPNEETKVRAVHLAQGGGNDVKAFSGVGPCGGVAEPNAVRIEAESLLTGGGIMPREGVQIDAVRDMFYDDVTRGVLSGDVGEPLAWGNEGGGSGTGKEGFSANKGGFSGPVNSGGLGATEMSVLPRVSLGVKGPAIVKGPYQW